MWNDLEPVFPIIRDRIIEPAVRDRFRGGLTQCPTVSFNGWNLIDDWN